MCLCFWTTRDFPLDEMEQIIVNVKQATEVSGNVNTLCLYSQLRDDVEEQRFNFHLSPPLHPPISAPLHPKMLFFSPLQGKILNGP